MLPGRGLDFQQINCKVYCRILTGSSDIAGEEQRRSAEYSLQMSQQFLVKIAENKRVIKTTHKKK